MQSFLNGTGKSMYELVHSVRALTRTHSPRACHRRHIRVFSGTASVCNVDRSIDCPCDDNATESVGAQSIYLGFDVLPQHWLLGDMQAAVATPATQSAQAAVVVTGLATPAPAPTTLKACDARVACHVRDIFGGPNGGSGQDLGLFTEGFEATSVPPHGSRFLLLSNCTLQHHAKR